MAAILALRISGASACAANWWARAWSNIGLAKIGLAKNDVPENNLPENGLQKAAPAKIGWARRPSLRPPANPRLSLSLSSLRSVNSHALFLSPFLPRIGVGLQPRAQAWVQRPKSF